MRWFFVFVANINFFVCAQSRFAPSQGAAAGLYSSSGVVQQIPTSQPPNKPRFAASPGVALTNPYSLPAATEQIARKPPMYAPPTSPYGAAYSANTHPNYGAGQNRNNQQSTSSDAKAPNPLLGMLMWNKVMGTGSVGSMGSMSSLMMMSSAMVRQPVDPCNQPRSPFSSYMLAKALGQNGDKQMLTMMECNGAFDKNPMMKFVFKKKMLERSNLLNMLDDSAASVAAGEGGISCDEAWNMSNEALFSLFESNQWGFIAMIEKCDNNAHTYLGAAKAELNALQGRR